ncbi:MAG TPA: paraquat-inducible protein A [Polyangia bacterium]|nr:paraquat-inducible protein A [Polyangia bacterium]
MKSRLFGGAILACLVALLAIDAVCAVQVYRRSQERAVVKTQYSEVNSIEYGLLSVDVWTEHLRKILAHKIEHFSLTHKQQGLLHAALEKEVAALLTQVEHMQPPTLKGKLGKAAVGVLIPHDRIPQLVDAALAEADKPETRQKLKEIALEKMNEYAAETRDTTIDLNNQKRYFEKFHVHNLVDFNQRAAALAGELQHEVYWYSVALVVSLLLTLGAWILVHYRHTLDWIEKPFFVLSVLLALVTLLAGLASPMLEIDARIQRVDFILLGEHLRFDDQVLFYQSKSIMQVVHTLFANHAADSLFVGVLILLFSIVLPISKLICTQLVLLGNAKNRSRKVLEFVAFKTSKWSMADVLVVAIFMAYVGFKSILDSQLKDLNVQSQSMSVITTNRTSLQPAFILFTTFVLFGLVLAEIIKRSASARAARDQKVA